MGLFENLRTNLVLKPLAEYLIQRRAESVQKEAGSNMGMVLRDPMPYQGTYGTQRTKPGGSVDFGTLRRFSTQYDIARACINRRKRQLNQLEWDIVPSEKDAKPKKNDPAIAEVKQAFKHLGGYRVRFREFIDVCVEDVLVLDGLSLEKQYMVGGGIFAMNAIDASTIRLRVDDAGKTPMPPEIAYRQYIRGKVVAEWTADEMYYEMMNPRTNTPYGLAPLETLVLSVSTALKSDIYNMHMLTEGNIPEGLFGVPETWQPDQIKEFQLTWDAALAGNTQETSRLKFVPDGKYQPTKKAEDMRYKELQEWLMQKTCMLFEIPPEMLGFTKTVNRATAETQGDQADDTGLAPLAHFFEEIFDDIIQVDMGHPELKFKFLGLEHKDAAAIATTNAVLVNSGQRTIDEVRAADGLEPLGIDKPFVIGTPTFIDEESLAAAAQAKADAAAALATSNNGGTTDSNGKTDASGTDNKTNATNDPNNTKSYSPEAEHVKLVTELRTFRKYAVDRIKQGKSLRDFTSEVLPAEVVTEINSRVKIAKSAEEARGIFAEFMQDYQIDFLANVSALKKDIKQIL